MKIVTADRVLDASALAALTFNEPQGPAIETRLAGAVLYAPSLIDVEMASVCLKKIRAALYPRATILQWHSGYSSVEIQRMEIAFTEVIDLAERTKLSFYDASYLWLARHLGAELVTLDAKLAKADSA